MTALLYVLALPIASGTLAALLGLRDGGSLTWRLVRVLIYTLVILSTMLWFGKPAQHAFAGAFVTLLVFQSAGFFAYRRFGIGVRDADES